MTKIIIVSRLIQLLLVTVALLQITVYVSVILFGEVIGASHQLQIQIGNLSSHFSVEFNNSWQDFALALEAENFNSAAILGSAELVPYAFVYYFIYRLFYLYRNGVVFTLDNIRCLKYIGATLLGWISLNLLYPLIVTLVLRSTGASGTLKYHLNIGTQELTYLLLGLVIYVIAWIMNEAIALKNEQELVI